MAQFDRYAVLTDAGAFISKLILHLPECVSAGAVTPQTFSVFSRRYNRTTGEIIRLNSENFSPEALADTQDGLSQGYWRVKQAYPCDAQGKPVLRADRVALDMDYGPLVHLSALGAQAKQYYNDFVRMETVITQIAPIPGAPGIMGMVFDVCGTTICPAAEGWQFHCDVDEAHPLRYGWFRPKGDGKRPLLVWLHGAGGGGTDPRYPVVGNKVTGFSSDEGQAALGGAWVLVPQCPTLWMDDGKGTPLMQSNDSIYVEAVKCTVDTFLREHAGEICEDRIFIAGNSNGGFMTLKQVMAYPKFYAAAVPVCEAIVTEFLTQEEIAAMRDTPIWFVHCRGDFVVDPDKTVVPLYRRLKENGAKEVHFTYLDKIEDTSGLFRNPDGTPYRFIPHFAWVPVYNNACKTDCDGMPVIKDGFRVGIFQWLRGIGHG